jgi:hypothetical protein
MCGEYPRVQHHTCRGHVIRLMNLIVRLSPFVSAKALRFMNTYQLTAFRTGPLFRFIFNENPYAEPLHPHKVADHTHAIPGSIALIQVFEPVARKPVTAKAVPDFIRPNIRTVLDAAFDAGFWFGAVIASATGAWILISRICDTETTVHSARGNQRRSHGICF